MYSVVVTNRAPSVMESITKVQNRDLTKWTKCFFFSDRLALNLSPWTSHETAAFYTRQCTSPSLFCILQIIS